MSGSRDRLPISGWPNSFEKPRCMDKHRNTSFVMTMANLGRALHTLRQQVASDPENAISRSTSQCHIRALHEEHEARMPGPPVDLPGKAAPAFPYCLCGLLQPSTTASRDPAADSWPTRISQILSSYRRQGDCTAGHGRAAP